MTREESIEVIKAYKDKLTNSASNQLDGDIEAFDIAIDALEHEQEIINALGLSIHVQSLKNSILEEEKHKLDKIRAEIEQKCDRINSLACVLPYTAHREIQELLCDIMDLFEPQERSDKE